MLTKSRPSKKDEEPSSDEDIDGADNKSEKTPYALQRPANTALRQQRLKAWHPLLTHNTVLPLLAIFGVLFAILGGVMYWSVLLVNELTIDYTDCKNLAPGQFSPVPSDKYNYRFHSLDSSRFEPPVYRSEPNTAMVGQNPPAYICTVQLSIPNELSGGVFLYYKLTNYYQNHRRYIKNIDYDQMLSKPRSPKDLQDNQCKPLGRDPDSGKSIYPCGLIANSVFNDTFSSPQLLETNGQRTEYAMVDRNIVWHDEAKHYKTPDYNVSDIVPPPFWRGAKGPFGYGDTYEEGKIFDPTQNEHFQVWMRTASFPTFRKLYQRNDDLPMAPGRYEIVIGDNYPVSMFDGTKSFVISTSGWVGGRNLELGTMHIAVAALCILCVLLLAIVQLVNPRRPGDVRFLSWNHPSK
ncbi:hypothetical protein MVES1_000663 [Malassezia vespertilionis]|uniref:Cdc50p n=1 Tax=Malassezia vespertilionis TaxID=2020962 RepID=A0A2N1JH75_9BASI|nr:uncharacterized protein MVES1_000663 [Malassezia vespertilionis]PKI85888.1 hypothetical protein MVES_000616 [Malassezia vespertilionis]WFD05333.1 hypothetical protein MVES1_000663 [Malassezia vespertilionis]